jgi:hypothetical protein
VVALVTVLADTAEEGRNIIVSMLVVGAVFVGVVVLGNLLRMLTYRRRGWH